MGSVVLNGATSGSTTITPTDAVTVTCTLPSTGGTLQTSGSGYTTNGVAYATSTSALATGSALQFDGTNLAVGATPTSFGAGYSVITAKGSTSGFVQASNGTIVTELGTYSGVGYVGTRSNNSLTFNANGSEYMRLTTSGYLGIGTSSPACSLDASGIIRAQGASISSSGAGVEIIYTASTPYLPSLNQGIVQAYDRGGSAYQPLGISGSQLLFVIGGNEKARIDTSGNLLVGTTSNSVSSGAGIKLLPANDGANKPVLAITTSASDSSSSALQYYSTGASAYRFYVNAAGTIFATSTSITAISDESLKTNIKTLETGLAQVLALQPRRFDWINGDALNVAGFIAQEVEQVLPDLVAPFKYNETETKLGLKMGDMIPTLVKAIQELNTLVTTQAETITSMQATITALQTKVGV